MIRFALGCLLAVCLSTVSAVALALLAGKFSPWLAGVSLVAGGVGGAWCAARLRPPPAAAAECSRPTLLDWLMIAIFSLFALRAFCWVIFSDENEILVLSPNNLGDMPLHLTYINHLARGAAFWPENPIFSGIGLHYPLGIDAFSALLSLCGVNTARGLVWVGLLASVVTCVALYRWGRWFAIAGFLFNGGLAGYQLLRTWEFADYQTELAWKSIPLSMFVTQRGLLYALPAGLWLLASWRERWFRAGPALRPHGVLPRGLEVLLYGTLPLFHLHTFLFLSAVLGCWLLFAAGPVRREVLRLLAWSFVPATVLTLYVTGLLGGGNAGGGNEGAETGANAAAGSIAGMIHLRPGWMAGDEGSGGAGWFWLTNFGVWPLAVLALLGVIINFFRPRSDAEQPEIRHAAFFVLPAVGVFLVACFVMFAPWAWDNTKLMIWSYLVVLPFLHELVLRRLPGVIAAAICFVLFFSGFVSLIGGLNRSHTGHAIADRKELDAMHSALRALPPDATFAAFPTYNHPLLLSGCKVVEGYAGHLFSHGIAHEKRDAELRRLMLGNDDWRELAKQLGVEYLFWGNRENEAYPTSARPWEAECRLVATGPWGAIFELGRDAW